MAKNARVDFGGKVEYLAIICIIIEKIIKLNSYFINYNGVLVGITCTEIGVFLCSASKSIHSDDKPPISLEDVVPKLIGTYLSHTQKVS